MLGLGTGPRHWNEEWHGIDGSRPVRRMREYIEIVRGMWTAHSGRSFTYQGERLRVIDYRRANPPPRERIPIYLGATQRLMLRLAGELADGVLYNTLTTPTMLKARTQPFLLEGLARSGRELEDIERGCIILTSVHEDRRVALDLARHQLAFYLQLPYFEDLLALHGIADDAREAQAAHLRGDLDEMVAAVTDRMIERLALVGTPDEARARLGEWAPYITTPMLMAPSWRLPRESILAGYRAIIETFGAAGEAAVEPSAPSS